MQREVRSRRKQGDELPLSPAISIYIPVLVPRARPGRRAVLLVRPCTELPGRSCHPRTASTALPLRGPGAAPGLLRELPLLLAGVRPLPGAASSFPDPCAQQGSTSWCHSPAARGCTGSLLCSLWVGFCLAAAQPPARLLLPSAAPGCPAGWGWLRRGLLAQPEGAPAQQAGQGCRPPSVKR